jgi:ligand-binding SRPBCC domain-containing protein
MGEGARIDYRLSLFGIPFTWRTRIATWEPGVRFVDDQLSGPYRRWHHTHSFADAPGGTLMTDRVEYALPFGPLGAIAHALFVRRTVERIFEHRRRVIAERLAPAPAPGTGTGTG